jgi:site-specific DNA recombinase
MVRRPPSAQQTGTLRCAVYTRKSTEEGLDQAFNSLDAQREACEAYIVSQRHEGWSLVKAAYDDGGFSGGSMERPALKRLLADVEAGKVDVIVVYKVDRLTRALADFAKIVEVLDARGASFVSVTQAFNTTTSMGRLTLNVLLSFAQFEREVTGERIRDKFAASKKKGMWMGGNPPLGYDVKDRKLVANEVEAKQVHHIMTRYLALGSIRLLAEELDRDGYRTKRLHGRGGISFSRGALSHLLGNPVYNGKVTHKGEVYDGEHEATVADELWQEVQVTLNARRNGDGHIRAPKRSLLAGMIVDGEGRNMTPSHTSKGGKRYRYYITHPSSVVADDYPAWRISATEVERIVIERLVQWLGNRSTIMSLVGSDATAAALAKAEQAAADLSRSQSCQRIADLLLSEVQVDQDRVILHLSRAGAAAVLGTTVIEDHAPLELTAQTTRIRQGKDVRLILRDEGDRSTGTINQPLVALLSEAQSLHRDLLAKPEQSIASLADSLGKCRRRSAALVRMALLAPDIVASCIDGTQPVSLTTKLLLNTDLPVSWQKQRTLLGFD